MNALRPPSDACERAGDPVRPAFDFGPVPGVADKVGEVAVVGDEGVGLKFAGEGFDGSRVDEFGEAGDVVREEDVVFGAGPDRAAVEEPDRAVPQMHGVLAEEVQRLGTPIAAAMPAVAPIFVA